MIACGSPDFGMIFILLGLLGICYLNSMHDMLRMICDSQRNFKSTLIRNSIVISFCSFHLLQIGVSDTLILGLCGIPILSSVSAILTHYLKVSEAKRA